MEKLSFGHHKLILSFILLILIVIGMILGFQLVSINSGTNVIEAIIFGLLFLLAFVVLFLASMFLRVRDEIHQIKDEINMELTTLKRILITTNDILSFEQKNKKRKK